MSITDPHTLTALADDALIARIGSLTARARESTADLIAHLVELEKRNLHLALGYRSLYFYCRSLHFSESESYTRMEVAHAARRFPVIIPLLADGRLHLTAVRLLLPHLGDEDHLALLGGAFRQSRREIDALLARWFPKADVPDSVRKLPRSGANGALPAASIAPGAAGAATSALAEDQSAQGSSDNGAAGGGSAGDQTVGNQTNGEQDARPANAGYEGAQTAGAHADGGGTTNANASTRDVNSRPADPRRQGKVSPLAQARYKVEFSAGEATIDKLRLAQELLSHAIPNGDLEAIFDRALDLVIEQGRRERHSAKKTARGAKGARRGRAARSVSRESRSIPAEVERLVWERDGGQCAFVGINGRRCEERKCLEFHHVKPWAAGGPPTVENISLRCRAHNRYEAERYFGPIRDARSAEM